MPKAYDYGSCLSVPRLIWRHPHIPGMLWQVWVRSNTFWLFLHSSDVPLLAFCSHKLVPCRLIFPSLTSHWMLS